VVIHASKKDIQATPLSLVGAQDGGVDDITMKINKDNNESITIGSFYNIALQSPESRYKDILFCLENGQSVSAKDNQHQIRFSTPGNQTIQCYAIDTNEQVK